MNNKEAINNDYLELLDRNLPDATQLDYSVLARHAQMLEALSAINNSAISVFDFSRRDHVYISENYADIFGFDRRRATNEGVKYFDARVHPEDLTELLKNGVAMLSFYYSLPVDQRREYKLINEYRILNSEDRYIRVVEQQQLLETDSEGRIWLALSVMDVSPNQDTATAFKSQLINFKTGEIVTVKSEASRKERRLLTERELSVLSLVNNGLLSKEISNVLSISVHTVNTHRQRILEKLSASNTTEAINYARLLGLLT